MKKQEGFSLIELLVVVIIIAIVAAIAIPNLLASRRAANEASAISSLRTIHSAEATYQATSGKNVSYGDLAALGTDKLIDANLVGGTKSGFNITVALNGTTDENYCGNADPTTPGTTGKRSFAVGNDGVIYENPNDGTAGGAITCTAGVIDNTVYTPIQ